MSDLRVRDEISLPFHPPSSSRYAADASAVLLLLKRCVRLNIKSTRVGERMAYGVSHNRQQSTSRRGKKIRKISSSWAFEGWLNLCEFVSNKFFFIFNSNKNLYKFGTWVYEKKNWTTRDLKNEFHNSWGRRQSQVKRNIYKIRISWARKFSSLKKNITKVREREKKINWNSLLSSFFVFALLLLLFCLLASHLYI